MNETPPNTKSLSLGHSFLLCKISMVPSSCESRQGRGATCVAHAWVTIPTGALTLSPHRTTSLTSHLTQEGTPRLHLRGYFSGPVQKGGKTDYFQVFKKYPINFLLFQRTTEMSMLSHVHLSFFFFFWLQLEAFRILVHQPRTEPRPPAMEAKNLNHWTDREVPLM